MDYNSPRIVTVAKRKQRGKQHNQGSALLSLKLIPEISAVALKAKIDKEVALWYCLRCINVTGSGRLLHNDAIATLVSVFGYSQRTVYRLLKDGKGKLWDIETPSPRAGLTTIKIWGLYRVCDYLTVFHLSRPVEIKARDFTGLRTRRAQLYASCFKTSGSKVKPISRYSIEVATGVKRRQQRRYDQVAHISMVANFATQQDDKGRLVSILNFVHGKARQWLVVRRLGNIYHSQASRARWGMITRVNAQLRQRSFYSDEARLPKRFFLTPQSVTRTPGRAPEAFLLVSKKDRLSKGRLRWCLI